MELRKNGVSAEKYVFEVTEDYDLLSVRFGARIQCLEDNAKSLSHILSNIHNEAILSLLMLAKCGFTTTCTPLCHCACLYFDVACRIHSTTHCKMNMYED